MNNLNLKPILGFAIYCAAVLGLIFFHNPFLFSAEKLYDPKINPEFFIKPALLWSSSNLGMHQANNISDITFRSSPERLGQALLRNNFQFSKVWDYPKFNIGIHGASKTSPIADETGIYVGSDSSWFIAFNFDGSVKWKFYAGDADRGIHSTALLDSKFVYFGTYDGTLFCLDKDTGSPVWSRRLGHTIGASLLGYKNSLIVSVETFQPNGYVVRIDRFTGEIIWISDFLGEQSHSTPALDQKNNQILLGANNSKFFAINVESGKTNWKIDVAGPVKGTPLLLDNSVYFADWGKTFWSVETKTGHLKWKIKLESGSQSSAAYLPKSELLAITDKSANFYLINKKGAVTLEKKFLNSRMLSSPVALVGKHDQILITCEDKVLCVLNTAGKTLFKANIDGILTGVPFVYMDSIFVAVDHGPLTAFSKK